MRTFYFFYWFKRFSDTFNFFSFKRMKLAKPVSLGLWVFFSVWGCASFDPALQTEFKKVLELEKQQQDLRNQYLLVLGQLKKYPEERVLRQNHADLKQKLLEIEVRLKEEQQLFSQYIQSYEKALVEERVEREMIQKEIHRGDKSETFDEGFR